MLSVASLRACNAVIAGFPAVGHGDGPENEVGFVNIEPNYANELHKRLSCRDVLIGGLGPSLQETPPFPPQLLCPPKAATWARQKGWGWDKAGVAPACS